MSRRGAFAALLGLAVGFGASLLLLSLRRPEPAPPPSPGPRAPESEEVLRLRKEIFGLRQELALLRTDPQPPRPEPAVPPDPPASTVQETFAQVARDGLDHIGTPEFERLMEKILADRRGCVGFLLERLARSASWEERYYAALLLPMADATDPGSVATLVEAFRRESDVVVRRMLARALAHGKPELSLGPLREAMSLDADPHVRLQAAYGLSRAGQDEGRQALEGVYSSPASENDLRRTALLRLVELSAPPSAPLFRRILSESREEWALMQAMAGLGKLRDAASLPALQAFAGSDYSGMVRDEARKAVEQILK